MKNKDYRDFMESVLIDQCFTDPSATALAELTADEYHLGEDIPQDVYDIAAELMQWWEACGF